MMNIYLSHFGPYLQDHENSNVEVSSTANTSSSGHDEAIVLFKSAEAMISFCLNNGNRNCIAVSDKEDLIELDVSPVLCPDISTWVEDNDGLANQG